MEVDVAIVGAGPAGLAAAGELGAERMSVALIDEYPIPGGRLLGQRYRWKHRIWDGKHQAEALVKTVRRFSSVNWLMQHSVYHLERTTTGWTVALNRDDLPRIFAKAVVVATGATEVPVALPNWTLPGVVSVGAAELMWGFYGVAPGKRGIIVGANPLSFAVAGELKESRALTSGIVMAPDTPYLDLGGSLDDQWKRIVALSGGAAWPIRTLGRLMAQDWLRQCLMGCAPRSGIAIQGTRLRPSVVAVAIEGSDRVSGIRLRHLPGLGKPRIREWSEPVDFVCIAGGLRPIPDLFRDAEADTAWIPELLGEVPIISPWAETSKAGLFAVGNATGVESALVAMAQGRLGAHGVVRYLHNQPMDLASSQPERDLIEEARQQSPIAFHPQIRQGLQHLDDLFWKSRDTPR